MGKKLRSADTAWGSVKRALRHSNSFAIGMLRLDDVLRFVLVLRDLHSLLRQTSQHSSYAMLTATQRQDTVAACACALLFLHVAWPQSTFSPE